MMNRLFLVLLALLPFQLFAQIQIQQVSKASFHLGEMELLDFLVVNSGEATQVFFNITLKDNRLKSLAEFNTGQVEVVTGLTVINKGLVQVKNVKFMSDATQQLLTGGGSLSPGSYVICIKALELSSKLPIAESCSEATVRPISPVMLAYPLNQSSISTTFPVFSWIPVVATSSQKFTYNLKVVEVLTHQTGVEALLRNPGLFGEYEVEFPNALMPLNAEQLEFGKTYAWQVRAFLEGKEISQSEIWTFKPSEPEERKDSLIPDGFIILGETDGNVLRVKESINFKIDRASTTESVKYEIYKESDGKVIHKESELLSPYNDDRFIVELETIRALKKEKVYVLKIRRGEGDLYGVRFMIVKG